MKILNDEVVDIKFLNKGLKTGKVRILDYKSDNLYLRGIYDFKDKTFYVTDFNYGV